MPLSNTKQKRSSHIQPMILTGPSTSDYQLWQENFLTDINDSSSKSPENNPRSLLGK